MTPSPVRTGVVCGWTPTDDTHDTLYTTIPGSTYSSSVNHDLNATFSSTPGAAQSSTPENPSFDSQPSQIVESGTDGDCSDISPYHNPTSLRRYKLKRSRDPKWAPRPPNAFILFRRSYAEEHKGEEVHSQEKTTLSKRASAAWKSLSAEDKKPWFDAAKKEADEHMQRNPDYVYKPNKKTRSDPRKHPALLSRREQVEAFVRKTTTRSRSKSTTKRGQARQCPTPLSVASSASPEPPGTPADQEYQLHYEHVPSRSSSQESRVLCPIPIAPGGNNVLLSDSTVSTASAIERPGFFRKGRSFPEGVFDFTPMDFLVYDHDYAESSDDLSGQSYGSSASSPITFFGDTSPDYWSSPGQNGICLQPSDTQTQPFQSASYIPPSSAPLMERRRRSNTVSTIPVPSPLTVITSSLSGWTRDDLVTSRMVPQESASAPKSPKIMQELSHLQEPMPAPFLSYAFDSVDPYQPMGHDLLTVPLPNADLNSTPRGVSFPPSSSPQNDFASSMIMRPQYDDLNMPLPSVGLMTPLPELVDAAADFESYNVGLRQHGIRTPQEDYVTPELVDPYMFCFNNFVEHT